RPVRVISEASEELLWSAYQLARFTVFVSITEGFGLPAAESIASGTPVLLSGHGSMREIGEGGGAHFVNPHVQAEVTAGMRLLLTDDEYVKQLAEQARNRQLPTWDQYAADTWNWLVKGRQPESNR
ncbi:MAG: glycosyltransferase, partial [Candidatus Nanopelagicales bacterium]|nr:glycosyltransferase [Candidatus Nanopelagicales bacterium]